VRGHCWKGTSKRKKTKTRPATTTTTATTATTAQQLIQLKKRQSYERKLLLSKLRIINKSNLSFFKGSFSFI